MKHGRVCTRCKWLHVRRIVCRKQDFWLVEMSPGSANRKAGPAFCRLLTKDSLSPSLSSPGEAKCRGREPQWALQKSFSPRFWPIEKCWLHHPGAEYFQFENPNAFSPYLDIIGRKERRHGLRNSFCNQKTQHNHTLQVATRFEENGGWNMLN